MFLFPFMILFSGLLLSLIVHHLNQTFLNYYDFVAFSVVLGGTLLVSIALLPWEYGRDVFKSFGYLFKREKSKFSDVLSKTKEGYQTRKLSRSQKPSLYENILVDGLEYIELGFSEERILEILQDQIDMHTRRMKRVGLALRNVAKYPPAFGLVGTVLGLVNIMKHLESASGATRLGSEMSVALVATMYGLLLANFLINPLAEFILKKIEEEEEYADLALEAIKLIKENANELEYTEKMNALVPWGHRYETRNQIEDIAA